MDRFSASDEKTKILFFDCECANCKGGVGKICSLGYVVVDSEFNILEKDDIVINPESEFDWYLFSGKGDISLSYSKEYFYSQPAFPHFYERIKSLLSPSIETDSETDTEIASKPNVVGFAVGNDVGFVNSACNRYNLPLIDFAAFDLKNLFERYYDTQKKLSVWYEFFDAHKWLEEKISSSSQTTDKKNDLSKHNSADDAMMTMLCFEVFCWQQKKTPFQIFDENKDLFISARLNAEQIEAREERKKTLEKLTCLYDKKSKKNTYTTVENENFEFSSSMLRDKEQIEKAIKLAHKIIDNGGIIRRHLRHSSGIVIFPYEVGDNNEMLKKRNLRGISLKELSSILE